MDAVLRGLMDEFLDRYLRLMSGMLNTHSVDGNHKMSVSILEALNKRRGRQSESDIIERGLDMRAWWIMDQKWKNILVLQFNFNVLMYFFRVCYSSLKPEHK